MDRQYGAALLLTIWVILLLSVLAGSALLVARSEALRGRQAQVRAEAIAAADGALRLAIHELSSPDAAARSVETRPMRLTIGAFEVEVTFQRERGKVDLNHASPLLIAELMRQLGHDGAPELARAIEAKRARPRTPGTRVFDSALDMTELGRLDAKTAACAAAFTTIYTTAKEPELAHADPVVIAAVEAIRGTPSARIPEPGSPLAGQMFKVMASARVSVDETLAREVVARITGNPNKAFLIYTWRTADEIKENKCR